MRGSHVLKHFSPAFARQTRVFLALLLVLSTLPNLAFAWVYPEHREITLRGIQKLDPHHTGPAGHTLGHRPRRA